MEKVLRYLEESRKQVLDQLFELLRIPSISAQKEHAKDVRRAAEWVAKKLCALGLRANLHETAGHPLVYGEWMEAPGRPTVLFYGHIDVQPVEPLEEWQTPPFEPTVREGNIYGRGTSDDKGQLYTHIAAVEAWLAAEGTLPVNVKFLIEGEEEIGSPNLPAWIAEHRDLMAADVVVISDTAQFAPDYPSLCTGLRGIAAFEIEVRTASADLHSGSFGGAVPNAIEVLSRLLTGLHDESGRVSVPGFYDDVAEPSAEEKASWQRLPFDEQAFVKSVGAKGTWGEPDRSILERIWTRPTLEFVGITGGHQGEGHKGIVPARALAKCSARLVPKQDPNKVIKAIRERVLQLAPPYADIEFRAGHGTPAVSIPTDSQWVAAAVAALEKGFDAQPVFIREGGSISIVTTFVRDLGLPCLLLGFGLPDDRIHSPNEKFSLKDFARGTRTSVALLREVGAS
ncbi:MAG: dipeptidase [Candidatus Sumerlaeaceae bacterium]|jgi:acetylornithine deacetylase/succinyl-diaminopimelate desuccinylase-like protein